MWSDFLHEWNYFRLYLVFTGSSNQSPALLLVMWLWLLEWNSVIDMTLGAWCVVLCCKFCTIGLWCIGAVLKRSQRSMIILLHLTMPCPGVRSTSWHCFLPGLVLKQTQKCDQPPVADPNLNRVWLAGDGRTICLMCASAILFSPRLCSTTKRQEPPCWAPCCRFRPILMCTIEPPSLVLFSCLNSLPS